LNQSSRLYRRPTRALALRSRSGTGYRPLRAAAWLLVFLAVGWIFVTTIAAGIARVLRPQ
jgi:hypothetical protein